jgi:uncharacterized lipoprotein YajG
MRLIVLAAAAVLAGCAATPQEMAQRSNWNVCRATMGGPNAGVAQNEAQRRNLDCAPLYPAISAQMQNQNAATAIFLQSLQQPAPALPRHTTCRSYRVGNQIQTNCD